MSVDPCEDLVRAVKNGDLSTARTLIDTHGLSYAKQWSKGYNLLCHALRYKQYEMVRLLLKLGAEVNCPDRKPSVFENEADSLINCRRYESIPDNLSILQRKRKPRNATVNADPIAALSTMVQHQMRGNSLNEHYENNLWNRLVDTTGYTPLHFAVAKNSEEMIKLLVSKGAEINAPASKGITPLRLALKCKQRAIANFLVDNGAEIEPYFEFSDAESRAAAMRSNLIVIKRYLIFRSSENDRALRKRLCIEITGNTAELYEKFSVAATAHDFRIRSKGIKDPKLLYAAVELGFVKVVEALLKQGVNPNKLHSSRQGMTVLHRAVFYSERKIIELLVSHGANVNVEDKKARQALTYAIGNKDVEIVRILLSSESSVVTTDNLYHAVEIEHPDIVKALLQLGRDVNVNVANQFGGTPLHYAAINSDLFYKQKFEISEVINNARGMMAKLLLDHGADVNAKANDGTTALHGAAIYNYVKVVEVLLNNKARVNCFTDNYMSPLHYAAKKGHDRIVRMLLDHGADVDCKLENGTTALHLACENGHVSTMKLLAARGADLKTVKHDGSSCLHIACRGGHCHVITALLKFGANIEAKDKQGKTPLHVAALSKKLQAIRILLDRNADLNVICNLSKTPVNYAFGSSTRRSNNDARRYLRPINRLEHHLRYYFWTNDVNGRKGQYRGFDNQIAVLMTQHMILLVAIGVYVSEDNINAMDLHPDSYLLLTCHEEILSMMDTKIGSSNVMFIQILTGDLNQVANYSMNKSIVAAMQSGVLYRIFPIYAGRIERRFKLGQKRMTILSTSLKAFADLSGDVIPEPSVLEVFSYLSNEDLENLIRASSGDE